MKLMNYEKFLIIERLGINEDVELLSNYLKSKIGSISIVIDNIPLKLSKPINKIFITIINKKESIASFDIKRSNLTDSGWNLYFNFQTNPTIDIISHEVNHAYQFIMKGREKSIQTLNKIKASRHSLNFLPFGQRNGKLNEVVDLIYYLNDAEINSFVVEIYADIKELSKRYKIDKETFTKLIEKSEPYNICKFVDSINLSSYLNDISIDNKIKFFSILKEKEKELKNGETNFKQKIVKLFKMIFHTNTKSMENIELEATIKKWDNYFKSQSNKLRKKLFRLYDLMD
jgi:hypothetical protein